VEGSESEVIRRCLNGDLDAFEELYRRHSARLFSLAVRMSRNRADAEDLLQDIFLLAHRKLATFKGESSLGTWLHRLAVNLCLDRIRSRQAKQQQVTGPLEDQHDAIGAQRNSSLADRTLQRMDLERAISELPERYRAAFVLHDVEGFEHREVASMLGVAEGTSKSLVHKARLKLRGTLGGMPSQRQPASQPSTSWIERGEAGLEARPK
jgi:RNA polymerase sigma-70 factor, ECF subfamily